MSERRRRILRNAALLLDPNESLFFCPFSLNTQEFTSLADNTRISRNRNGKLPGSQLSETNPYIQDIVAYLKPPHPRVSPGMRGER